MASELAPYDRFARHELLGWHPRRRELLVLRQVGNTPQVHAVHEPGLAPVALTDLRGGVEDARYAPDEGRYFVFTGDADGEGDMRLFRKDLSTGALDALSPPHERVTGFAWAPGGRRLAYATQPAAPRDPAQGARTALRTIDPARPSSARVLAIFEHGTASDLRFSADGRRLAFVERLPASRSRLSIIDVESGKRRPVTPVDARAANAYSRPWFSPDGRGLFALSDRASDLTRLVYVSLATGRQKVLTGRLPHPIDRFAVSSDAGRIAFTTNENGADVLRFLDLRTLREQPRPPLVAGVIGNLRWRPHSDEIGFTMTTARSAGDVFSYDAKTNKLTRWTNGNSPDLNTAAFAEPRAIAWKSFDRRRLTGWLYAPPERFSRPRPVLVRVHAAGDQARPTFIGRDNYLVNELGIALVYPNLRGSSGFGRAFAGLADGARGADAFEDLGALLDWIATQPQLDADRVAIAAADDGAAPALAAVERFGKHTARRIVLSMPATEASAAQAAAVSASERDRPAWLLLPPPQATGTANANALFTALVAFGRHALLAQRPSPPH